MRLFISYSRTDKAFVEQLADLLHKEAKEDVWFDQRLVGGVHWWPTILEEIRNCGCFIMVVSPNSIASIFCQAELNYAIALNKPIIPLLYLDMISPQALRKLQHEDVRGLPPERILNRVQQALVQVEKDYQARRYDLPSILPPPPAEPQSPQTAFEMYVLAEEAASVGHLELAEIWYKRAQNIDPQGIGQEINKRLEAIRHERARKSAYDSVDRMDRAGNEAGAKVAWEVYIRKFGTETDPKGFEAKYGQRLRKASSFGGSRKLLIFSLAIVASLIVIIVVAQGILPPGRSNVPSTATAEIQPATATDATTPDAPTLTPGTIVPTLSSSNCASVTLADLSSLSSQDRIQLTPTFWLESPIPNPRITQPFGVNAEYYTNLGLPGHEGIDFGAALGTTIYAAQMGIVLRIEDVWGNDAINNPYGNQIRIRHDWFGQLYETIYANMDSLTITEGDKVLPGQPIGRVGNTGRSTGPHLHFGLKQLGATELGITNYPSDLIDPTSFLTNTPTNYNYAALVSNEATNPLDVIEGETFCAHWIVRNMGNTTWSGYTLEQYSGSLPNKSIHLPVVRPAEITEVTISLKAPTREGDFTGYWMLRDEQGSFFPSVFAITIRVRG